MPAARRPSVWAAAALVAAVLLAYANTLRAPFVYDDTAAIVDNPTIRRLWPLTDALRPQKEGGLTVSGRPVLNLSFAVSYAISGPAPWGHHVFNILVHAANALLLFGLVRRTFQASAGAPAARPAEPPAMRERHGDWRAFAIAALWALHPVQTQAVTYTVQRAESLMALFYLLTLYAFVRTAEARPLAPISFCRAHPARLLPPVAWSALSIGACALGMATKEVMATAPVLVFLLDRTFFAGTFGTAWRKRRGYYLGLAASWLVLAALLATTGGNRGGTAGLGVGVPWWAYGLTQFQAVVRYLALSVWPHPLVFEYGTFWVKGAADVVPHALVVLPLLAGTGWALWRRPIAGFLGASFFLILAPTSLTPGTIQMIVEHRMYLPLAALVTAGVLALHGTCGRGPIATIGLVALAGLVLTADRNRDYRSRLALWADTVAKRPANPRAHEGLAEAWQEAGHIDEALAHRRESIRLLPDESRYHYNLALTLADAGRFEEAIRHYELSLRLAPAEARTHNNLAIALGRLGQLDRALSHYATAIQLRPDIAPYHYNYGIALLRAGRLAEAASECTTAARLDPENADAHFNAGTSLVRLGRADEGIAAYRTAVRLKPGDAEYRITLGSALLVQNRADDALAEFRRALELRPDAIEAQYGAGNALAALRRYDESIAAYEAVLRPQPDHANARFKLGNVLFDIDRVPAAIAQYEAAVRLAPDDAEAHHNLGVAYARLERWNDAEREFTAALRLKPSYPDAQRHLEQLRRLLGK